jgi:hypothetical protein
MASSKAATVHDYLQELPEERRQVVSAVRDVIVSNLPDGYAETMAWGMISYGIPLSRYPNTYNRQPLAYAALAAQKNGYSLYLMGVDMHPEQQTALQEAFRREGKRLDMGKSCVRFKKADDLPLDAIGRLIAGITPEQHITAYEASRAG